MTKQYYQDTSAIAAMLASLPPNLIGPQLEQLSALQAHLAGLYSMAADTDTKVAATAAAYDDVFRDPKSSIDDDLLRRKLNAVRAARRGKHRSRLELLMSLLEDGSTDSEANDRKLFKALRNALERPRGGQHHPKKVLLGNAAAAAGTAIHDLCDHLKKDINGAQTAPPVFASAIDVLLPVAKARGLAPEHVTTLEKLRESIKTALGRGDGSTVWPSTYISSSSSSSGG